MGNTPSQPQVLISARAITIYVSWEDIARYLISAANLSIQSWTLKITGPRTDPDQLSENSQLNFTAEITKSDVDYLYPATNYIVSLECTLENGKNVAWDDYKIKNRLTTTTSPGRILDIGDVQQEATWLNLRRQFSRLATGGANILVAGKWGNGQSTFVNVLFNMFSTLNFESNQFITKYAAGDSPNHVTRKLTATFRMLQDSEASATVWETMGITHYDNGDSFSRFQRIVTGDMANCGLEIDETELRVVSNQQILPKSRKMHSVIFVFAADELDDKGAGQMKPYFDFVVKQGMIPVVLLNKIDRLSPLLASKPSGIIASEIVHDFAEILTQLVEFGNIYPIMMPSRHKRNLSTEILAWRCLIAAVGQAQARIQSSSSSSSSPVLIGQGGVSASQGNEEKQGKERGDEGEKEGDEGEEEEDEDDLSTLEIFKAQLLGQGFFGEVYGGRIGDEDVAVKMLKVIDTSKLDEAAKKTMTKAEKDFDKEIRTLTSLPPHDNVAQLLGVTEKDGRKCIIMKRYRFGDLKSYLDNARFESLDLRERKSLSILLDIAKGLAHLHAHKIVHRDLAARNILFKNSKRDQVVITDFGLSRALVGEAGQELYPMEYRDGLPYAWLPPESLMNSIATAKSDVWSFGVIVWEVITQGLKPLQDLGPRQIVKLAERGVLHTTLFDALPSSSSSSSSSALVKLMKMCLIPDPNQRPFSSQVAAEVEKMLAS